jgi:hypothetical protein
MEVVMDATTQTRIDESLAEEESVGVFSKTYDLGNPEQQVRAQRDLAEWGRAHTSRAFDPEKNTMTLRFRQHPDDRWRPWEACRKAKILEERG